LTGRRPARGGWCREKATEREREEMQRLKIYDVALAMVEEVAALAWIAA
jgi:hypothetical protein